MDGLDLYCERIVTGVTAEPLNVVTNAAFFVAAWLIWRRARRAGAIAAIVSLLLILVTSIGVGSILFHAFATPATRLMDVIPIAVFQIVFIWGYTRRVLSLGAATALATSGGFLALSLYARLFPETLNGSLIYAPAVAAILVLGVIHYRQRRAQPAALLAAAAAMVAALIFRTADNAICQWFPLGTHFLWHLLTATATYFAMSGLVAELARNPSTIPRK